MKIICVEDGSVDLEAIEQDGLKDGGILVYRQGSQPPYVLEFVKYKEENTPHIVQEVICLKCLCRWIAVRPKETLLKDLECMCGNKGYVIATGQELEEEK